MKINKHNISLFTIRLALSYIVISVSMAIIYGAMAISIKIFETILKTVPHDTVSWTVAILCITIASVAITTMTINAENTK